MNTGALLDYPAPDPASDCLNCGKPGSVHIDQKCPFEASTFAASESRVAFKETRGAFDDTSGITFDTLWGFTKVYK